MSKPIALQAYSYKDVESSISGPGGSFDLTEATGKEGIKISMQNEAGTMQEGADGSVMPVLVPTRAATLTLTLLKTSPVNGKLDALYRYQAQSSAFWGKNLITMTNPVTGDLDKFSNAAFQKMPDRQNTSEGPTVEWSFIGTWEPFTGAASI